MTSQLALLPSKQALRRMDALAIAWAITFLVLGVIAWNSLRNLAQLGVGLGDAAESLELAARAVALLGEVPVVGDSADQLSTGIEQAAASTRANAEDVRSNVPVLAAVIGLAIAVLPLPLLAGVYLPLRLARRREVQGLRRLLSGQVDPLLVEHLAHGAVSRIRTRSCGASRILPGRTWLAAGTTGWPPPNCDGSASIRRPPGSARGPRARGQPQRQKQRRPHRHGTRPRGAGERASFGGRAQPRARV
jgi:hypothetical protein